MHGETVKFAGKKFGPFPSNFSTQPFQYFQIVNLVDCLSSWYKFIVNEAHGGEFANFIVGLRICDKVLTFFGHVHCPSEKNQMKCYVLGDILCRSLIRLSRPFVGLLSQRI
jgi:hypothetical protein